MGKRVVSAKVNELVERVKAGEDAAFEELAKIFAPMIKRIASRVAISLPPGVTFDDLLSWGLHGLWDAALKYKLGKGAEFSTFAYWRIRGEMLDAVREMTTLSRQLWENWKKLSDVVIELEREFGREPTVEEIAERMGMSEVKVRKIMNLINFLIVDDVATKAGKFAPVASSPDPEEIVMRDELKEQVMKALETLTEKQRLVIQLYYWENMTVTEIAKVLGLTPARVSQIHSQAMVKIRKYLKEFYGDASLLVGE